MVFHRMPITTNFRNSDKRFDSAQLCSFHFYQSFSFVHPSYFSKVVSLLLVLFIWQTRNASTSHTQLDWNIFSWYRITRCKRRSVNQLEWKLWSFKANRKLHGTGVWDVFLVLSHLAWTCLWEYWWSPTARLWCLGGESLWTLKQTSKCFRTTSHIILELSRYRSLKHVRFAS